MRSGDAFAKSSFDVRAGIKNTAYLDIGKAQKGGRRKQFDTAVKREGGYEKKMKAPAVSDETQRLVTESKKELKRKRAELAQLKEQRESGKGMASERSLDQRQKRLEREMRMAQDQIKGAKKQRWSERAEGMVGTHKLKLFKAALGMKPLDAAEARELGKKELDREKLNAQLQKARAKAKSTSGDESKAAHQEASRLQSELDELNGGINQLNDQQRTYFNAYVRYEKAELRQKESTKQLKQQSADKDVGAPSVVRRVAGQKARKELNKGKNESIFEKLVREEVEKQEGNTKDKEDEE